MEETADVLFERLASGHYADWLEIAAPVPDAALDRAEAEVGVALPGDFRRFLNRFGAMDLFGAALYGVGGAEARDLAGQTRRLRAARPALPPGLVPFAEGSAWIGPMRWGSRYVCFDARHGAASDPWVTQWTPQAARRERIERTAQTFSRWLREDLDGADSYPRPPRDWSNVPGWDRYWERTLAFPNGENWHALPHHDAALEELGRLRARGLRRGLFAGSGVSLVPHAFAHCGFEATAIDASPFACRFVEGYAVTPDLLARMLPVFSPAEDSDMGGVHRPAGAASRERAAQEHRPGGSITVLCEDLFGHRPVHAYNFVHAARLLHGFAPGPRDALARRFYDWTAPGGVCIIEALNVVEEERGALESPFLRAGFFLQEPHPALAAPPPRGLRLLRYILSGRLEEDYTGLLAARRREEEARLDAGEKLAVFRYSSG